MDFAYIDTVCRSSHLNTKIIIFGKVIKNYCYLSLISFEIEQNQHFRREL